MRVAIGHFTWYHSHDQHVANVRHTTTRFSNFAEIKIQPDRLISSDLGDYLTFEIGFVYRRPMGLENVSDLIIVRLRPICEFV